jgi:hypothetical protein
LSALLDACHSMLPLVREHRDEAPETDALIRKAERALVRAERELIKGQRRKLKQRSNFFGRVGNHYDFEITVSKIQERVSIYRCEGWDKAGRMVVVRIGKDKDLPSLEIGDCIFFRGKIREHRLFHGEAVTYIDVTSGILTALDP